MQSYQFSSINIAVQLGHVLLCERKTKQNKNLSKYSYVKEKRISFAFFNMELQNSHVMGDITVGEFERKVLFYHMKHQGNCNQALFKI